MDKPVDITTNQLNKFCAEMQELKDGIKSLSESMKRIENQFECQIKRFDDFKSYSRDESVRMNVAWGERFDKERKLNDNRICEQNKQFVCQNELNEKRFSALEIIVATWKSGFSGSTKTLMVIFAILNSAIVIGGISYLWNLQQNITDTIIKRLSNEYTIEITK